jgi:hypothetical protein
MDMDHVYGSCLCHLANRYVYVEWWRLDNRYLRCCFCGTVLTGDHKHTDINENLFKESKTE